MGEPTPEIENGRPDGAMYDLIMSVDPAGLTQEELLTFAIVARRLRACCEYAELAALAERFRGGDVDLARFVAVHERTRHLADPAQAAEVDRALAEVAGGLTRSQLCRKTTALVAKADPEGYERRCKKAREERRVEFSPLPDGMAKLMWILPAAEARELFQQVCADAKGLPADGRTTDQKRCDVLRERMLGQRKEWNVRTFVTVGMKTLMGLDDEPGQLAHRGGRGAGAGDAGALAGDCAGRVSEGGGDQQEHVSAVEPDERVRSRAERGNVHGAGVFEADRGA